jgi:hypothetical protein
MQGFLKDLAAVRAAARRGPPCTNNRGRPKSRACYCAPAGGHAGPPAARAACRFVPACQLVPRRVAAAPRGLPAARRRPRPPLATLTATTWHSTGGESVPPAPARAAALPRRCLRAAARV